MRISPAIHRYLREADPHLGDFMRRNRLPALDRPTQSPYRSLLRSIIGQQISTTAARAISAKFFALAGDEVDFARLAELPETLLRETGLSRQKILYIRDLARRVALKEVPPAEQLETMTDENIIKALVQIKGIGVWTVQMLLIFHFHRPDVWPVRDLGMKRGFMNVHGRRQLPSENALERFGTKLAPYRTFAARYYWLAAK